MTRLIEMKTIGFRGRRVKWDSIADAKERDILTQNGKMFGLVYRVIPYRIDTCNIDSTHTLYLKPIVRIGEGFGKFVKPISAAALQIPEPEFVAAERAYARSFKEKHGRVA